MASVAWSFFLAAGCLSASARINSRDTRLVHPENSFENRAAAIAAIMKEASMNASNFSLVEATATNTHTKAASIRACPRLEPPRTPATNVTALHPCDIEVIAAIGDSLTTADQARSTNWLNLRMYPGLAWSIGGDEDAVSVPRFFEESCGRMPQGPSTGSGNSAVYNFNFAVSGARVEDMPQQATTLVSGLKESLGERYPTAWKMVTLLIGGNNLCDVCIASKERDNDDVVYEKNLRVALETLKEIPNVVVNVVLNMDYTQLAPLVRQFGCLLLMPSVCPCLGVDNEERLAISREYIRKYNDVLVTLVAEFNRKVEGTNTRFVVQPFAVRTALATSELISKADCFHPSAAGQAFVGRGLWINLFEPVGQKRDEVFEGELVCPTERSVVGV